MTMNMLYFNWGSHFFAFSSVVFFITLAARGLFVYQDSYKLGMRLSIVVLTFGGELAMTFFPDTFLITWQSILFNVAGALFGMYLAEGWSAYRKKLIRKEQLPSTIAERYADPQHQTWSAETQLLSD